MPFAPTYRPSPEFVSLGPEFHDVVVPAKFPRAMLRFRNQHWAERVGLGALNDDEWQRHFARLEPLPDNLSDALALRYHGHQFGVYNAYLGDGRGFLLAQLRDTDGRLLDLGTKGSGQTPWSRGGDGRLTLKGGVREVLATEMLEALGVNTSKSFSLFETGEHLVRHDEPSPTRSSVLVRLSHSHVRFGTFQRLAHRGDDTHVVALLEYCARHYHPSLASLTGEELAFAFLRDVTRMSAEMCASWMVAGFVHGVMNTDNMNVTGETFDYGPYRFLPTYDPDFVAAYFDETGLYSFGRQPQRIHWNLTRLAQALENVAPASRLADALTEFEPILARAVQSRVLERLGLRSNESDADGDLVDAVYAFLGESGIGYDQFFFDWYGGTARAKHALGGVSAKHYVSMSFRPLRQRLEAYEPAHPERLTDPYFARDVPCTLLIDEIETLWDAIADHDDWSPFEAKIAAIRVLGAAYGRE